VRTQRRNTAINRISDYVADQLRDEVLAGDLAPGARLRVADIAERLGVSRTPVDDGLHRLESEGLVLISPRRGTFVAELDVRELTEIFEVRRAMEELAVELVIDRGPDGSLVPLHEHLARLSDSAKRKDGAVHARVNAQFHEYIVGLSENRRLVAMYGQLYASILIARIHAGSRSWLKRADQEMNEHEAIVAALERRDKLAARDAIARHLRRGLASLIEDLESRGGPWAQ
jgi:DNA-binding GntR family transcriptional regulator